MGFFKKYIGDPFMAVGGEIDRQLSTNGDTGGERGLLKFAKERFDQGNTVAIKIAGQAYVEKSETVANLPDAKSQISRARYEGKREFDDYVRITSHTDLADSQVHIGRLRPLADGLKELQDAGVDTRAAQQALSDGNADKFRDALTNLNLNTDQRAQLVRRLADAGYVAHRAKILQNLPEHADYPRAAITSEPVPPPPPAPPAVEETQKSTQTTQTLNEKPAQTTATQSAAEETEKARRAQAAQEAALEREKQEKQRAREEQQRQQQEAEKQGKGAEKLDVPPRSVTPDAGKNVAPAPRPAGESKGASPDEPGAGKITRDVTGLIKQTKTVDANRVKEGQAVSGNFEGVKAVREMQAIIGEVNKSGLANPSQKKVNEGIISGLQKIEQDPTGKKLGDFQKILDKQTMKVNGKDTSLSQVLNDEKSSDKQKYQATFIALHRGTEQWAVSNDKMAQVAGAQYDDQQRRVQALAMKNGKDEVNTLKKFGGPQTAATAPAQPVGGVEQGKSVGR